VEERLERQARNEALVREVNERIHAIDQSALTTAEGEPFGFHCECGRQGGCEDRVWMPLAEYEKVRQQDDRFALVPGHETEGLEVVVAREDGYVIVDKVEEAEPFISDDPRGRPSE
jgi:hypothetical protein